MITSQQVEFKTFTFPVGELHVRVESISQGPVSVRLDFEKNEDIIELLLLVDAVRNFGGEVDELIIPYVPFSRQDRIAVRGDTFSLRVFAGLINGLNIKRVHIIDPHSDVTPALIRNAVIRTQAEIFAPKLSGRSGFWLVSPDGGALKKTYQLAARVECRGVIECGKHRDPVDGTITGAIVHAGDLGGHDAYIVDDICDGGRTFIEIAKVLRTKNAGALHLLVSHGFFTKGMAILEGLFTEIITADTKPKTKQRQ